MRRVPKTKLKEGAYVAEARGYDVRRGTHGGVMTPGQTHITPSAWRPGQTESYPGLSDPNVTYYTAEHPDTRGPSAESTGWGWASSAARQHEWGDDQKRNTRPREVVHRVEPEGIINSDQNMNPSGFAGGSMQASRLKITDTEWIKPPGPYTSHVQGTLPHVNWNQYAPLDNYEDFNNQSIRPDDVRAAKREKDAQTDSPELVAKLTERLRGRTMDRMF
jgi:hypothetical protein